MLWVRKQFLVCVCVCVCVHTLFILCVQDMLHHIAPRFVFDGQLLQIASNTALFSLLGTTFGGNGQTTFALPDLRGRVPMHVGTGPGLTTRFMGQKGGSESETLTVAQIPPHGHGLGPASTAGGGSTECSSRCDHMIDTCGSAQAGGGQPHNNLQPFLTVRFIIALTGTFPSQN